MKLRKTLAIAAIGATTLLAACGSDAPKTSAEMEGLLVNADELGNDGLVDGTVSQDFALPSFDAFVSATDGASEECKAALEETGGLTYDRVGSAGKYMATNDQSTIIMSSLFSSENESTAIADTLSNVAQTCNGQKVTDAAGNEYEFHTVGDGYEGVEVKMAMADMESNTVALVGYKGKEMVYISGIGTSLDDAKTTFDKQMEKL